MWPAPRSSGRAPYSLCEDRVATLKHRYSRKGSAPAGSHAAQGALNGQVIDLKSFVIAVARQRLPAVERIENGAACIRLTRERGKHLAQPSMKLIEQRLSVQLAIGAALVGRLAADDCFDLIERTDSLECLGIEGIRPCDVERVALLSCMSPTSCFEYTRCSGSIGASPSRFLVGPVPRGAAPAAAHIRRRATGAARTAGFRRACSSPLRSAYRYAAAPAPSSRRSCRG